MRGWLMNLSRSEVVVVVVGSGGVGWLFSGGAGLD